MHSTVTARVQGVTVVSAQIDSEASPSSLLTRLLSVGRIGNIRSTCFHNSTTVLLLLLLLTAITTRMWYKATDKLNSYVRVVMQSV